jgi:hypothetical protein
MPADLARALVAHPRFPGFSEPDHVTSGVDGYPEGRLPDGMLLRHRPAGVGSEWWWLPALDDAATAGVLLGMLWTANPDGMWGAELWPSDVRVVEHPEHGDALQYVGATLGEAAARALLALWGPHAG